MAAIATPKRGLKTHKVRDLAVPDGYITEDLHGDGA
jgi:hypothetical protein